MDDKILQVAIAGFFHDIGKFADNKAMEIYKNEIQDSDRELYQKKDKNKHYSHVHALYTAKFIENYKHLIPDKLYNNVFNEDKIDIFQNLAAMHHKPETAIQTLIQKADCLTSGIERDKFEISKDQEIQPREYKKTRMLPIFEQILNNDKMDKPEQFNFLYPLEPISPVSIFPRTKKDCSGADAENEYKNLFKHFLSDLENLKNKNDNILLWFEHFASLAMVYLSSIPAVRAGKAIHDVSLYDHLYLTSAFASALYLYHKDKGTLNKDIIGKNNNDEKKFLMISGNFFGIQNFIFKGYGNTRSYRSKLLRGRSFYVSLLAELAADMLCQKAGLPFTSVILNSAGIITILAPDTDKTKNAVKETKDEITKWLMKLSYGQISFNFSQVKACENDFVTKNFSSFWDKMVLEMEKIKCQKFDLNIHGGVIEDYLDNFKKDSDNIICPICGIRPVETGFQEQKCCGLCKDQISIGEKLVKKNIIAIYNDNVSKNSKNKYDLYKPIFNQYQIRFSNQTDNLSKKIVKCWDISLFNDQKNSNFFNNGVTRKIINSYVPIYNDDNKEHLLDNVLETDELLEQYQDQNPMQLNHIALMAKKIKQLNNEQYKYIGTEALGVLKADVDNLAMIMGCGLDKQKRFTVSRIATLSRQIHYFFALYLPNLLQNEFKNIYTVFAGGDDLFLIGPWNEIYDLSVRLKNEFKQYVCNNDKIHFSAGIVLQKSHVPIDILAESSENSLKKSKTNDKNQITMFNQTVSWDKIEDINNIYNQLKKWFDKEMSISMYYKLNYLIFLAEKEAVLGNKVNKNDIECLKWRTYLKYYGTRNIMKNDDGDGQERKNIIIAKLTKWIDDYRGKLRIPLWRLLYNNR